MIEGVADNALSGFALAAKLQPDLVITDLQMPGSNGFALVKVLRQEFPSVRSIVISARDDQSLHASSLRHGADAFISKPQIPELLPGLLAQLFSADGKSSISQSTP